jgi:hypothetical protein
MLVPIPIACFVGTILSDLMYWHSAAMQWGNFSAWPDHALSSHVVPLGLVFDTGSGLPDQYRGGAFIGEHGSWDRPSSMATRLSSCPSPAASRAAKRRTW